MTNISQLILEHTIEIGFSMLSAIILFLVKIIYGQIVHRKEMEKLREEECNNTMEEIRSTLQLLIHGDLKLYAYRLTSECRNVIRRGSIRPEEVEDLPALFEQYRAYDGNGRVEVLYKKAMSMPVKED